jgi:hypothetical protein
MAVLDVHWHANPKVLSLGLAAMGLHAWGISYCDSELTDGFIPAGALPSLAGAKAALQTLLRRGRWQDVEGGYRVHDYLAHNRSRAQVLAKRASDAQRNRVRLTTESEVNPPRLTTESEVNPPRLTTESEVNRNGIPSIPGPYPGSTGNSSSSSVVEGGVGGTAAHLSPELLAEHERRLQQERNRKSAERTTTTTTDFFDSKNDGENR